MSYTRTSEARTTSLRARGLNRGPSVDNQPVPRRRTIQPVSTPSSSNTRGHADNVRRRGVRRSVPASQTLHQTGRSTSNDNVSLLRSSGGDIEIHDGQFNAVAGSHISVTINAGSGSGIGENREDLQEEVHPSDFSKTSKGGREDRGLHKPSIPSSSSWEIYYRHIGAKGRGSPLWIPEPNKSLHIDYQRRGMSIGDVGIITFDGGFDFLFNICLPKGHPINPPNLPDIFTTVEMSSRDIRQYTIFRGESYLSSASIKKSLQQGGVSSLIFESSASEGAILAMPAGSNSTQLLNIGLFRKWVIAHAEDLYKYANDTCGREARNGDVRIVTGFDKTTKWGMATFSNRSSTAAESSLLFKFKPLDSEGDLGSGRSYGWEYSGTAEVRAGPERREIEELRAGDPSQEQMEYENQCLFLRTLNVTLQDKIWEKLSFDIGEIFVEEGPSHTYFGAPNFPSASRSRSSNYTSESHPHNRIHGVNYTGVGHDYFSTFPPAIPWHPSKEINETLLRVNPDLRMAITDDSDWISVLKETDHVVPSTAQILTRMMTAFCPRTEEGIVFLQRNSSPSISPLSTFSLTETPTQDRRNVIATSELEFETDLDDDSESWSSDQMTDDEAKDQLIRQREQLPRKPQKQPVYLLAAQSRSYPGRPGDRIEQRVLHHQVNTIDKDVLEARRQRDIFAKLPASSFQGLGKSTSRNGSLLTQLMNPDPEVVPAYNQPRHEFRSNEIRVGSRVNTAPMKPVMPATTTQSALAMDKGNVEGKKPSHRFNASHLDLQRNKSVTAKPLSSPVLAGRASIKAPPSIDLSSTMSIDVHGLSNPVGKASEEEAELEIQVSKSVMQEKLKALARRQGIAPNIQNADAKPAISHGSHGDDDNVPQWAKISLPPQHLITSNRSQGQTQNRRLRKDLPFVELERLSNNQATIPIPLDYPYGLPITAPPSTPRTTRRLMLSAELSESLRRNLLWERQVNKVDSTSLKRSGRGGGSNYSVLADHQSLTASPSIAQLDANGTDMPDNSKDDDTESRRTAGGLGEQDRLERGEKKVKVATRSKSWVNDYHYSGW